MLAVPRAPEAQRAEDRARRRRAVERVEVDAGRAVGQQVGALHRRVGDAELGHRLVARPALMQVGEHVVGDRRAAHARDARELVVGRDRHDAGDDRDLDADRAGALDEVEVERVVEEELGDEEADAGVDLLLEVAQVVLGRGGVDVGLREARRADGEAGSLPLMSSTSSREYSRPPSVFVHSCRALRRVAAQREHVLEAQRAHLVERRAQLVDGGAHAGEVRHRLEADLVADARDDLERLAARRAAGAVGDADEVGRQRAQGGQREVEVRLALGRPGREELEGEHRAVARGVDLVDAHRAHGRAAAVKFGVLMPIHGVRAVLVLACERSPVPP